MAVMNELARRSPSQNLRLRAAILWQRLCQVWRNPDVRTEDGAERLQSAALMLALAVTVGACGGVGTVVFNSIIAFFYNLFFYGQFGLYYDANIYTKASPWGALVIGVPVAGSLLVSWITKTFAPEARGHGVPEVLNAIYYRDGKIRPIVVVVKGIASAITVGTGGSAGREGPIVQVGSALGSLLGQIVRMPTRQRNTLIAAGAAAGVAAAFNAPIGAIAFAVELLMVSITPRNITLVAVAAVTGAYIGRMYDGLAPAFVLPQMALMENHMVRFYALLLCIPLGVLTGLAAVAFIRSILFAEEFFETHFRNDYIRHALGMLMLGVAMYMLMLHSGHYYIDGVGYATIMDVLNGTLTDPWFLGLLCLAKMLATDVTLGSGASGGVFSPSLFMGATLGAMFGNGVHAMFPMLGINPVMFVITGMAAMVGGGTGALLTSITMTFEQTRDYGVILPIILAVTTAHLVRSSLCPHSIYTLKLARRGTHVPQGLQAATSHRLHAQMMMSSDFRLVELKEFKSYHSYHRRRDDPRYTVIVDGDSVVGLVREEMVGLLHDETPEAAIDDHFFSAAATTGWTVIMRGMKHGHTETVLVFKKPNSRRKTDLIGVITPHELAVLASEDAELMD